MVDLLQEHDIACAGANPLPIRNFARGCGLVGKTDQIDPAIIARFDEVVQPRIAEKPTESEKKPRALVHRRDQIIRQISAEHNRGPVTVGILLAELPELRKLN